MIDNIGDYFDDVFKANFKSKNLFNKETAIQGYYVDRYSGTLIVNPSYYASDFIPVVNGEYIRGSQQQYAFYNLSREFVGGSTDVNKIITVPVGASYIRLSMLDTEIELFQFEKGSIETKYYDYNKDYITKDQLNFDIGEKQTISSIMSQCILSNTQKYIKFIGDSITQGVGGTGFAQDGEIIMTVGETTWRVNTNGKCWANSCKAYFEEKLNCKVKNFGCSGIDSGGISANMNQLIDGTEDIVIVILGTNDRFQNTKQQTYDYLKSIYNYCNSRDIKVIFMSNIPASQVSEDNPVMNWHMEDLDMIIMKLCNDLNIEYISLYKKMIEYCKNNGIDFNTLLGDGLHPNDIGYSVMFYLISNGLQVTTSLDKALF